MTSDAPIRIHYFSDVLCVWAYAAHIRLEELLRHFGSRVEVSHHFLPIFADTDTRIGEGWAKKGGYEGFGDHVQHVCEAFPHVALSEDVWRKARPASSSATHHFLKAVQLLEHEGLLSTERRDDLKGRTVFEELMWRIRCAFFCDGKDIAAWAVQRAEAEALGIETDLVRHRMDDGRAMAGLFRDIALRDKFQVRGSPTYVLNEGRQQLYGNVGYKVIEANVEEILHRPDHGATWC